MRLAPFALLTAALFASHAIAAPKPAKVPKNIIYMIGDGMGPAYLAAYRYYMDKLETKAVERTVFDELWVGNASTYPDDDTVVTDSAAGATALATRHKTYNGAISVDKQHQPLETLFEVAKRRGKRTGVVVTSPINHATPASFLAHNPHRKNMNAIADAYVDRKVAGHFVADLMLGGGTDSFVRADRNIAKEFQAAGYHYADSWAAMKALPALPALALLAPYGLPPTIDHPEKLPLTQMTSKALALLGGSKQGFVMMIEGSQIDWCGHANDIACAMAEMHDFGEAIKVARAYVDAHPDTQLVITADHETGGLSLGAQGRYEWKRDVVRGVRQSADVLAQRLLPLADDKALYQGWLDGTAIVLKDAEQAELAAARSAGIKPLTKLAKQLVDRYSSTGWTTGGHTAADVPVLAYGRWSRDFAGFQDNTEIAARLLRYLDRH
ncbi:alkaline phosphatase [Chitinimonas sp. BJYL2]|uniref:alkaline phosphatase n=1 Tax=Chitinimonas sp. BJYL2 TaxID=2976696 RepID=UPI0022B37460|nr:alkaline phosphatase [Chitinimonas sp. BJYL2]